MSCKVKIYSPNTGGIIESKTWSSIYNEVNDTDRADRLFAQTRSNNFKAWFGDVYNEDESHSKVVTEDGEPLVVYHSSMVDFDTFNPSLSDEIGFHFGTEQAAIERHYPYEIEFSDSKGTVKTNLGLDLKALRNDILEDSESFNIKPFFLNIRNMVEGVDYLETDYMETDLSEEEWNALYKNGTKNFSSAFTLLAMGFHFKGLISRDQLDRIFETGDKNELQKALGNPDGYWYINAQEAKGQKSYVVFDPKNIKSIFNTGDFSGSENTMYSLASENAVDFTLKVINALQKTPRKVYPSNSIQGFYNDLIKQGAPKNQIELLKEYILKNNIQEINVADLIAGLASEISYIIEINTAKSKKIKLNQEYFDTNFTRDGIEYTAIADHDDETGELITLYYKGKTKISKEEFTKASQYDEEVNTQHYAHMNVPGGTNRTENEVAIPSGTRVVEKPDDGPRGKYDLFAGDTVEYKGDFYIVENASMPEFTGNDILDALEDNIDPRVAKDKVDLEHESDIDLNPIDSTGNTHPIFNIPKIEVFKHGKLLKKRTLKRTIKSEGIVPSIKGHAAFATDNGIGWFMSDDKENKVVGWKEEDDFLNSETAQYNPITKNDKIIWGHPAIGKSYAAKTINIIDFDSYKLGINKKYNLYIADGLSDTELRTENKTREARENWRYEKPENAELWNQFIRDAWQQAKKDAKKQGAILFASDLLVLREFGNEVDKALTMPDELFFQRSKQRNNFIEGELGTKVWKSNLNKAINNFQDKYGKDKVIKTDKYLSELFEGNPKTRRILEVQSDWGQKQRKSAEPDINIKYDIQQIINDLQKSGDLKIDCN